MAAVIELMGGKYTVDEWEWSGPEERIVKALQAMMDPEGPSGEDPDPDGGAVDRAVELFGGKVTHKDRVKLPRARRLVL